MEKRPRRNSLRYPGYDYAQAGAVFVTVSTHQNQRLFGTIQDGQMVLSPAGIFVNECWNRLPQRFPDMMVDAFIVMPDHLHGIIMTGAVTEHAGIGTTVGFAVRSFKNSVSSGWQEGVASKGWPRYHDRLWHSDYFDRIIRNDREMQAFREYIATNPARWEAKRNTNREDQHLRR